MSMGYPTGILSLSRLGQPYPIRQLQERAGYSLTDEGDGRNMVPHLIDGEDPTADHFSLRGDKVGEDKTRAVTQHQAVTHIERLDSEEE